MYDMKITTHNLVTWTIKEEKLACNYAFIIYLLCKASFLHSSKKNTSKEAYKDPFIVKGGNRKTKTC